MKNYKVFDAYKTNSAGVWYFVPDGGVFKKGKPCKGFGAIKYAEGSVYTGDIFYDGKNFNKKGYGQQDFTKSNIGDTVKALGEKKYKFVGQYDYRKTDWIYGNGVLYYTYEDGNPSHFKKGFFKGLDKIGEYKGEFDYSRLIYGYKREMEFDYDENAGVIEERWEAILSAFAAVKPPYTLFIGDSYFELADNPEYAGKNVFEKFFDKNCVNAGICGSKFADWLCWADKLKCVPAPEKIVINLGFNDLHNGKSVKGVYGDFIKFNKILRNYFPESRIYLVSAVHCPNDPNYFTAENEYNKMIADNAIKNKVIVGEWNTRIEASGQNCFHLDAIHPNEYGYGLFAEFIEELLKR